MTVPAPVSPSATRRPGLGFAFAHPAHALALALGAGLSPIAPGTAGTLGAWAAWALLAPWLGDAQQGWLLAALLPLSIWASTITARHMAVADPGAIVIDEVIAFWLVLWLWLPASLFEQAVAFALFRFFDAAKPGPVGWADRLLHGAQGWRAGLGIVLDDLVAAFCTLLTLALWRWWLG